MSAFLELRNLRTHFPIYRGLVIRRKIASVKAVDGVSLSLKKGEILGLVGRIWMREIFAGPYGDAAGSLHRWRGPTGRKEHGRSDFQRDSQVEG